jgi:hypothetical protein
MKMLLNNKFTIIDAKVNEKFITKFLEVLASLVN